ncbi:MAG: glycosyltransferase family 4 protein [Leptolyngbyaceae bacterium]|nr:glycosyltransferase family 4 protein [Leptolyngbyaceae bacterium]
MPASRLIPSSEQSQPSQQRLAPQPNVLILNQFFPPDFVATGQLIEELAKQLVQQNLDIEVFTGQPGYAFQTQSAPVQEVADGVRIRRSRMSHLWLQRIRGKALSGLVFSLRSFLFVMQRQWFCFRPTHDVVLVTTAPPFLPIVVYLAHRLIGIPYVCLIYDLYPDVATRLGVIPPTHWLAQRWQQLNRAVWSHARQVIVLSDSMKQRVMQNCPSLPSHKVTVIHSWADPNHIVPRAKQHNWFAQTHDLVKPFTVLYSGNMGRCHDLDTVLEAMQQLQSDPHPVPIQFVFIGGGAKLQVLQATVAALNLTHVTFLPYQAKEDLPYSLTAGDLALVSVSETMDDLVAPSKLYSALAAGLPVAAICPLRSYLNPLIAEARCGATFGNGQGKQLAAYIQRLRGDRALAVAQGKSGRHYLETHFTPQKIAAAYAQVLHQAAQPLSQPTPAAKPTRKIRKRSLLARFWFEG